MTPHKQGKLREAGLTVVAGLVIAAIGPAAGLSTLFYVGVLIVLVGVVMALIAATRPD